MAQEKTLLRQLLEDDGYTPECAKRLLDVLDSDLRQQINLSFNITNLRIDRSKMQVTLQDDLLLHTEPECTIPLADLREALLQKIK